MSQPERRRDGVRFLTGLFALIALAAAAASKAVAAPDVAPALPRFSVRLELNVTSGWGWFDVASLHLQATESPADCQVEIRRRELRVSGSSDVGSWPRWTLPVSLAPGTHVLVLTQRRHGLAVCLDHRVLRILPLRLPEKLRVSFTPGRTVTAVAAPRLQRIGRIQLADDFARQGEGEQLWETVAGRFALNTSLNPGSSQSAFEFWSEAPDGRSLAVAAGSYWFWDDYRVGVSVKPGCLPVAWGLVFGYIDPENYHILRCSHSGKGAAGRAQIVRRRAGEETVLAESGITLAAGQWYRTTAVTHGTCVKGFVNGMPVGMAQDPFLTGGRIGLLVEHSADVYFDDVTATSTAGPIAAPAWKLEAPFGPCEQFWSDFSKKRFYNDRFMVQWSHPRSFWTSSTALARTRSLYWFRTRLFHDLTFAWERKRVRLPWPREPLDLALFAEPGVEDSGYRVRIAGAELTLARAGTAVARAALDEKQIDTLVCGVDQGRVTLELNGETRLTWQDPEPLRDGYVGADFGRTRGLNLRWPDWRDNARISSTHRLDYGFDSAPTAWSVQSGRWRGTHRWACVPRWSFFGGRGFPGPPGISHGNTVLWNRRIFQGDFDLELFVAPMEGTPQRVHFAWPVTANVVFGADGRNLDSGYMLLFGTYDVPTRLYRGARELASWDGRLNPRLRFDAQPLYNRITRVWQQIRIRRRGTRITVDVAKHDDQANYLGLERAFEVEDLEPRDAGQFGLWTWGANGMAIARATISFEHSPGPAVTCPTDNAGESRQGDVAVTRERDPESNRPPFVRVRNMSSGGSFSYDLLSAPIDLAHSGLLEFDFRISPGVEVNLIGSLRGQTVEVGLSAPEQYRENAIPIGRIAQGSVGPGAAWVPVRFDFLAALRRVFPTGPLRLDRLCIGSPLATLEQIAGLGVNRTDAHYDIAGLRWQAGAAATERPEPRVLALFHGRDPVDDFEHDTADWTRLGGSDGASLYRDPHRPAAGRYALRLLNDVVGGPAGAWITRTAYNLEDFPRLAFDYRVPAGVEINLLVQAGGRRFEIRATGVDSSWPVLGSFPNFQADGQWHHAEFDLQAALGRVSGRPPLRVEALAWADSKRMSSRQGVAYWIDNFCLVPAVGGTEATEVELGWNTPERVVAYSCRVDGAPDTVPPETATGTGNRLALKPVTTAAFLHLRVQNAEGVWSNARHIPLLPVRPSSAAAAPSTEAAGQPLGDAPKPLPPPAPFVSYIPSACLCSTEFEWQRSPEFPEQHGGEFGIRRGAWVLPCAADGATGDSCVELLNLADGSFFSGYFRRSGWDPEKWPLLAFDYKFLQSGCALNLTMLVNEALTTVEWTGANRPGNYFYDSVVGATEPAVQDGRWHHVEIDLLNMLLERRFPDAEKRADLVVSELATWATSHGHGRMYANAADARVRIDNFRIFAQHGTRPAFAWKMQPPAPAVAGYSYSFDDSPDTVPPEKIITTDTSVAFADVPPGIWHFHVRACTPAGEWGASAHRRIEIVQAPANRSGGTTD